jgi:undecaprenyl-phosphate 4-deoxy-4-formamido-L-arabinose transferase
MNLSAIVPVYNSEQVVSTLVRRLQPVLARLAPNYELILVNDGSRDRSWEVLRELAAQYPCVRSINLMRNYGQHNALLCGIRAAKRDVIVTLDDDLQHPPEEIPRLLEKLAEGYDVVYGTPHQEQQTLWRVLAAQLAKLVLRPVMGADIARKVSAFRAFRAQVWEAFVAYQSPFVSIDVLLTWGAALRGQSRGLPAHGRGQ